MFRKRSVYEKGDSISNCIFDGHQFPDMRICEGEGENLSGVFGGNELLEYNLHPDYTNKKVAVIGGGNVAMDCARTVKKKGAKEVKVIYRRSREEMPAEQKEIEDAIAIPSEAIVPEMGKNKVFVYRSGVADPVDVIIGLRTEAEVQIVRGLSVGDTILTSGTLQLRKGMPVELQAIN